MRKMKISLTNHFLIWGYIFGIIRLRVITHGFHKAQAEVFTLSPNTKIVKTWPQR